MQINLLSHVLSNYTVSFYPKAQQTLKYNHNYTDAIKILNHRTYHQLDGMWLVIK